MHKFLKYKNASHSRWLAKNENIFFLWRLSIVAIRWTVLWLYRKFKTELVFYKTRWIRTSVAVEPLFVHHLRTSITTAQCTCTLHMLAFSECENKTWPFYGSYGDHESRHPTPAPSYKYHTVCPPQKRFERCGNEMKDINFFSRK